MLAQPLDTGNPKYEQFYVVGYLWTKAVLTIFLLMNSIPFQMSKPKFIGFRITLVGFVIYPNCINVESVCHVGPAG